MTPPRMPDHGSDEILDMTPVFTEDENTQEQATSAPTPTPTPAPARPRARAPQAEVRPPRGEYEEFEDMIPSLAPWEDTRENVAVRVDRPVRSQASRPVTSRAQAPARTAAPPRAPEPPAAAMAHEEAPPAKPTGKWGSPTRIILMAVVGLVVVALVGKTLGQAVASGGLHLATGHKAQPTTPASATYTPTPSEVQVGNKTITTTPGALILLNPGVVRQGTSVGVTGSGFDPGGVIDLTITRPGVATPLASSIVQADKTGGFYSAAIGVPDTLSSGSFIVQAKERNSHVSAQAVGTIAGGAPQVKLGIQVGKPGDVIVLTLHGFAPRETINVFWNTMSGQPVTTFQADGGGGIGQGKVQVPFGAVGNNTFLFVGTTSQSLVAASFLVLQLYPTVKLGSYALRADNAMTFSGSGFGPNERVFVFLNNTNGSPLAIINTDSTGAFKNAPGFVVPFTIAGKQTLIFMGEQSRAPDAVNFTVLPYTPVVQASTYGGLPGMTISFYGTGFARNEIVHVYAGHTKSTLGTLVSCFQVDSKGAAAAAGSYLIPGNAQGTLGFALVGEKSGGVGVASLNISAPPAPVHTPPQAPFTCPLDPPSQQGQQGQAGQGTPPAHQGQPAQPGASTGPQGDLAQSGQHLALQRVSVVPATTSHAEAALALAVLPHALEYEAAAARMATPWMRDAAIGIDVDLRQGVWNFLEQLRISPLVDGLGLLWLALVIVLNITVLRRSSRQESANREAIRTGDAETASTAPALVTMRLERDAADTREATTPPWAAPIEAGATVESHLLAPPASAPHPLGVAPSASVALPAPAPAPASVEQYASGPSLRAARCTATWRGGGRRPGHDATFVRSNIKLSGDESRFGLFLVADGRSGSCAGIAPSEVAVEHIARRLIAALSTGPAVPPNMIRPLFKYAVIHAGDALLARNATYRTAASTTVTGALVVGGRAYIVNVGNSRTYLHSHGGGLWQITRDHSVVSGLVSAGLVGATAIDASPSAQQLYRSLGDADLPVQVDTFAISIFPGDQLLLCSDGLWRRVRDSRIEAILRQTPDPQEATWKLIQAASANGSEDDISAIVVHLHGADARGGHRASA